MSDESTSTHEHELEAEYLSATDAEVVDVYREDGVLRVDALLPCPTCGDAVRVTARVEEVVDADVELPLDDASDVYD